MSFCLTTLDTLPSGFVSPWPGRALLDPWLPDQQTVVIRRGLPCPTTQQETHKLRDSQPQPCPDGAAAPGPLFALRTPHTPTWICAGSCLKAFLMSALVSDGTWQGSRWPPRANTRQGELGWDEI